MRFAKEKSALFSAVVFSVITILLITSTVSFFYYGDDLTTTAYVVRWIGFLGLAITAFLKNKKAILIASCITLISFVLFDIDHLLWSWGFYAFLNDLFEILPYAMFTIVIFLSSKGDERVKRVWFLPSVLCLITLIFWYGWHWIIILNALALFFAGLWLRDDLTLISFSSRKNVTNSFSKSPVGDAEKLKVIKDLLDSGTITQEEFDAKKKEILK